MTLLFGVDEVVVYEWLTKKAEEGQRTKSEQSNNMKPLIVPSSGNEKGLKDTGLAFAALTAYYAHFLPCLPQPPCKFPFIRGLND